MEDPNAWVIVFFLISLLIGISLVSVHYRKEYEEQRELVIKMAETSKN